MYNEVLTRLKKAYGQILTRVGDPLDSNTLVGPLHSSASVKRYQETIEAVRKERGTIEFGGKVRFMYTRGNKPRKTI